MDRAYTVREIDDLRRACEQRWLFGSTYRGPGQHSSRSYRSEEKDTGVEEMVRTYILAGIVADDIYAADRPPASDAVATPPPSGQEM